MRVSFLMLSVASACFSIAASASEPRSIVVEASAIRFAVTDQKQTQEGQLVFRGGLRLSSPERAFGGISGFQISADGENFLAITDESHLLRGTLRYRDGRLSGVDDVTMTPLTDEKGVALRGKEGDAEGLALDGSLTAFHISFEGDHRVWRYEYKPRIKSDKTQGTPILSSAKAVALPEDARAAPSNGGYEALARLADARLLLMSEDYRDEAQNFRGFILALRGEAKGAKALSLKAIEPFRPTDIQALPNGDLLTLERRFNPKTGVGFQMRRIAKDTVKPGAILDGPVVADLGMAFVIDNMEGMAIRTGPKGETLVYVASDDNFNAPLQQNLLILYELRD